MKSHFIFLFKNFSTEIFSVIEQYLFCNLEQAQSLEGEDRKDYAEKVAFAFMEALGIKDEDEDDAR